MPFPYTYICDLLQQLEDELQKPESNRISSKTIVANWFDEHRSLLNAPGSNACAILSTILPERRTDRVYFIQAPRLQSIIGQAFLLGASRVKELRCYQTPGLGVDLGDCVESLLKRTPNPDWEIGILTVEEIDSVLGEIASTCRFSSPAVRVSRNNPNRKQTNKALVNIYRRLSPRDAKWFTRLVLKSYEPIVLSHYAVFHSYHPLLPQLLKVRDDFTVATAFLQLINESPDDQTTIASMLKPQLGMKVGRQPWFKARSIHHCLKMGKGRDISCEQKLDGEYCQIHIDRSKGFECIQIFSKSGKDSTMDREGLHGAIRDSLKLDSPDCPVKEGCILEGELVVYSTRDNKILPFHKIRKHVHRSGSFIGTKIDSQRHLHENLMIVYYDILMLDGTSFLGFRHSERMKRLANLITCRTGCAEIVQRKVISLSTHSAGERLRETFAECIVRRWEGLVLKPDEPYFDFTGSYQLYSSCNIKLKKEYVQGWGDVGDFAVVGASYDPAKAKSYNIPNLKWTHFFIGCLDDRDRPGARLQRPRFMVVNVVELNETMLKSLVTHCSHPSVPFKEDTRFDLDLRGLETTKPPGVIFIEPMVFDIRCFSFEKTPNTNFFSMRFPMVSKVHFDRTWKDSITFTELQEAAIAATETPQLEDSQEMQKWIAALETADPRKFIDFGSQQGSPAEENPLSAASVDREIPSADVLETTAEGPRRKRVPPMGGILPSTLTPPSSSAESATRQKSSSRRHSEDEHVRSGPAKRIYEPETRSPSAKRPRRSTYESAVGPTSPKKTYNSLRSPVRRRRPLGDIDCNNVPTEQPSPRNKNPDIRPPSPPHASEVSAPAPTPTTTEPTTPFCPSSSPARSFHTARCAPSSPSPFASADAAAALPGEETPKAKRTGGEEPPQPPRPARPDPPPLPPPPPTTTITITNTTCPLAGADCALANHSLLLSPCIAAYPWVTETLLGRHGIAEFSVDPAAVDWHPAGPHRRRSNNNNNNNHDSSSSSSDLNHPMAQGADDDDDDAKKQQQDGQGRRRRRVRKICLVESRREEATAAFLRRIEREGPRRKKNKEKEKRSGNGNGGTGDADGEGDGDGGEQQQREWIAVYDWRVLEELAEREEEEGKGKGKGKGKKAGMDPWRKWYVGIA
ncbi:hypothetical protein F4809DRAFT_629375 [Biscogniauxia mediterranea]|nr:hypothetical protein F4809DRAFT_629375 [Biscogniauxia mediterranea]